MALLIRNFTKKKINGKPLEVVMEKVFKEEKFYSKAEVSLVFVGEKRIRDINREYRGVDRVTDVISFEGEGGGFVDPQDGIIYLGEIFICTKRVEKQSWEKKHSFKKELDILFVHGLFHLLGYDHINDKDYGIMNKKETAVLNMLYK